MNMDFLRDKRKEKLITQEAVARRLGIGKASYQKIEAGINNLHPKHWKKIASLLGISESDTANFAALIAVQRRKRRVSSGEVKPDAVDHVFFANEQAKELEKRVAFIRGLSEYDYAEFVNAFEQHKGDLVYGGSGQLPGYYLDWLEDKAFEYDGFTADEKVKIRQFLKTLSEEQKK